MFDFSAAFSHGLTYSAFLDRYADAAQCARWDRTRHDLVLTEHQIALLGRFTRRLNILCLAGAWCGDCAEQCPILAAIAEKCSLIDLRFVDRDADVALAGELKICGGSRVPVAVFLSEDMHECARFGDRTLTRYRNLVQGVGVGAPCGRPMPIEEVLTTEADEWLREIERVQWMLRLSPRLRRLHGD